MVISVDVKFVFKFTNEADWDGLRDHLGDVSWLDTFKHATFAAKE